MSLPSYFVKDVGGTISLQLTSRPDNATVTIYGPTETVHVDATAATVDTISTTVNGAVTAGASSVTLTNAANVSAGDEFYLRTPSEKVRAKTLSSHTVTLWAPCLYAHADGVDAEGTKLSYDVSAGDADTLFWDGRAKWNINGGASVAYSPVECITYPLDRLATYADVVREFPKIADVLDEEVDINDKLDDAHDELLSDLGGSGRARTYTGSSSFVKATVFKFLVAVFRPIRGAEDMQEKYEKAYVAELHKTTIATPRDADQDGHIEADEQMNVRRVRLVRG